MRSLAGPLLPWCILAAAVACKTTSSSQDARGPGATDGPIASDAVMFADAANDGPTDTASDAGADRHGADLASDALQSADTAPVNAEATQVCRAAISAWVDRSIFCFGYDIDDTPHLDACPDYYFNPDSNRTVAEVEDCIEQIKAIPCSELDLNVMGAACLRAGKRPVGAACSFPSQCQSNFCQGGFNACGTCRDGNFPPGATCERGQCQLGDFCDERTYTCVSGSTFVYAAEGELCRNSKTSTVVCQGDLRCTNVGTTTTLTCQKDQRFNCGKVQCAAGTYCKDSTAGTCTAYAKLGEACSNTGSGSVPSCDPQLRCANGKCAKRGLAGNACDADQPCSEFYDCVNGSCRLRDCPA